MKWCNDICGAHIIVQHAISEFVAAVERHRVADSEAESVFSKLNLSVVEIAESCVADPKEFVSLTAILYPAMKSLSVGSAGLEGLVKLTVEVGMRLVRIK